MPPKEFKAANFCFSADGVTFSPIGHVSAVDIEADDIDYQNMFEDTAFTFTTGKVSYGVWRRIFGMTNNDRRAHGLKPMRYRQIWRVRKYVR